jgi:hypothetical protein
MSTQDGGCPPYRIIIRSTAHEDSEIAGTDKYSVDWIDHPQKPNWREFQNTAQISNVLGNPESWIDLAIKTGIIISTYTAINSDDQQLAKGSELCVLRQLC